MMNDIMQQALKDWEYLNSILAQFTEGELQELLNDEMITRRRKMYVERIHQRLCKLRTKRERDELFSQIGVTNAN